MPTDQEVDATIAAVRETLKSQEEVREQIAEYERAKEEFARQNGFTPEKLAADAQRVIDHILEKGSPEEKAELERVQAEARQKLDAELAQLDAHAAEAGQQQSGAATRPGRSRVRELV